MGKIRIYPPVKLIAAITVTAKIDPEDLIHQLEQSFSMVDHKSELYDFSFTDYYEPEMGLGLKKQMLSFSDLIEAENLPDIKISTNQIEEEHSKEKKRILNIDPGYICAAKLVLATTKDYDHRVYLSKGIFGDVHLRYRQGSFRANEWTYPDYMQNSIIQFFHEVRSIYMQQLINWKNR